MAQTRRAKKERLTLSVSRDTLNYLETGRARAQAPSMSAYFEELVRELKARNEMDAMEAKMKAHYDNLSAGEMRDEADWGRVGAASLSRLED
jgi:hypothetical protein